MQGPTFARLQAAVRRRADAAMSAPAPPDAAVSVAAESCAEGGPAARRSLGELHSMVRELDAVQEESALHSERVAAMAFAVALELGWPPPRARDLAQAARLHDVGKAVVPDGILAKPGPLSDAEFDLVMRHPAAGAEMLTGILTAEQTRWILHHHERCDGRGYPDQTADAEIPEGSRILGVVDAFDVMTSGRPYQEPLSVARAIAECRELSGSQFDERVVEALTRVVWPLPEPQGAPAGAAERTRPASSSAPA
jgi:HD-GYP domain-containing protein (c-di-GMP phosphodiesterase class II)